jgi:hypothetical protein
VEQTAAPSSSQVEDLLSHGDADQVVPAKDAISFSAAKISRADIHIDWQGGFATSFTNVSEELRCFIRPGKVKGALHFQGNTANGYQFGRGQVVARLYNKSIETKEKGNDAYAELLTARYGESFNPEQDVWRLEFEIKREGMKGFRLYAPPEEDDPEEEVEVEMSAEELQHIGTLPRFFARMEEPFLHLTRHWLAWWRRATMPTAPAGRHILPGSTSARRLDNWQEFLPSTMRSADSCVAHGIEAECASLGGWRVG